MSILIEEKLRNKLHDTQEVLDEVRLFLIETSFELPRYLADKIDKVLGYGEDCFYVD